MTRQDAPVVTLSGDVRTPLMIGLDEFGLLPLSFFSRTCGPGMLERFVGVDLQGLVQAADPLTTDPNGFTVQVTASDGRSVTLPGGALDPVASVERPIGPLLVTDDRAGPLPAENGPFFLMSQSCDTSKDLPAVQSITVRVTHRQSDLAQRVDDRPSLLAASLQPGDLPDLEPLYMATRAITRSTPPQPNLPALSYYGYWSADGASVVESAFVYDDAAAAATQLGAVNALTAVDAAQCDEDSLQVLPPLGLGDADTAYTFLCPASGDRPNDLLVAVDQLRIGRVVATLSVSRPPTTDPTAQMRAAAGLIAARLGALGQ